jgi:alpha,alpha-trehalose phosphorylase
MQVIKQADVVLANFIRGNMFTLEEKERNYNYYEPKCNHGSSLSTAIHSIMASELGKHDEAYQFFRCSAYMDISDFKHNTADGLHLACLGGVWMTVVNGFLGMRHYPDGVLFNPHMPAAWESYNTRFTYKGATMEITVNNGGATFTLVSGEALPFRTEEENVVLTPANPTFTCKVK